MEKGTVLLFDGKTNGVGSLEHLLESEGYSLQHFDSLENVQESALRDRPAAILIDLDDYADAGWLACSELKDDMATRKSALLLMSSNEDENLRIKGLEIGADDFIKKPFSAREIIARIKAITRRIVANDSKKIRVKDIEIDLDEHRVRKAGKSIDLTYIQFKLLYLLASRRNNVFSRKEILEKVWGKKVFVTSRTVDVHIKRLREKLGEDKYPSQYIETIHGTGYRFL
jgi:two-component system alkaline phosphatase synthesis response regulator PhoP